MKNAKLTSLVRGLAGVSMLFVSASLALTQVGCISAAARAGSKRQARQDFHAQTSCNNRDAEHLHHVDVAPQTLHGHPVLRGEAVEVTGCGQTQLYLCYLESRGSSSGQWDCK